VDKAWNAWAQQESTQDHVVTELPLLIEGDWS